MQICQKCGAKGIYKAYSENNRKPAIGNKKRVPVRYDCKCKNDKE